MTRDKKPKFTLVNILLFPLHMQIATKKTFSTYQNMRALKFIGRLEVSSNIAGVIKATISYVVYLIIKYLFIPPFRIHTAFRDDFYKIISSD